MPELVVPSEMSTVSSLLAPGISAVKAYWRPFLLLQFASLLLVLGYYNSTEIRSLCETLSHIKQHWGLAFSAISASLAGALLPEGAKFIMLGDRTFNVTRLRNIGFALCVFAVNGIITDLQYRGLAWLLGSDNHAGTIIKKMLFDQFVTTPIYGVPYWVFVYSFRAQRYHLPATVRQISPRWYIHAVLPLLIPAWWLWIPMVSLIYALPGPLQFWLFCFALGGWSLLMVFVASSTATATPEAPGFDPEHLEPPQPQSA